MTRGGLHDPRRDGGREEGGLAGGRGARHDALDVRREAAIEHLVALVEDEDAEVLEIEVALAQVIEGPAGRADDDLSAAGERAGLGDQGPAAVEQGQLAGGGRARGFSITPPTWIASSRVGTRISAWTPRAAGSQPLDERQAEGEGLAGAGPGLPDDVIAGQHDRNRLGLDRRRDGDAHRVDGGPGLRAQAQLGERGQLGRRRDLAELNIGVPVRSGC